MQVSQAKILRAVLIAIKGMLVPVLGTLLLTALTYPLGAYDCHSYGANKDVPVRYAWFTCYVKDKQRGWFTKQEYQESVVGARLLIEKLND